MNKLKISPMVCRDIDKYELKSTPILCRQIDSNRWLECLDIWKLKNNNEICPNVLVSQQINYKSDNSIRSMWVYAIISYFNERKQQMEPMKVISFIKNKIPDLYKNNICDYIFRRPTTWIKKDFF